MSEFNESKFLAELRSVVDEIGGKLFIKCGGKTHPSLVGEMRAAKILKNALTNQNI